MAIEKPNYLKHQDNSEPYTRVWNKTIDIIPDNAALGVYVYLIGKPENWVIHEAELMKRFKRGRDHIRGCLSILKKAGLYEKKSIRDEKGHVIHWETNLYAQVPENPSSGLVQITENPTCGKTHLLDNPTHIKEKIIQRKKIDTNGEHSSLAVSTLLTPTPLELVAVFSDELPESPQPVIHAATQAVDGKTNQAITDFKKYWKIKTGYDLTIEKFREYLQELKTNAPGFLGEYTNKGGNKQKNGLTVILYWENFEKYLNGTLF